MTALIVVLPIIVVVEISLQLHQEGEWRYNCCTKCFQISLGLRKPSGGL
jgi:hypothetical protein